MWVGPATVSGSQSKQKGFFNIRVLRVCGRRVLSYKCGAAGAAAAVVAVCVATRQIGCGNERVSLICAAVLSQNVHALLTVGLAGIRQGAVTTGIPRHQIHTVLRRQSISPFILNISDKPTWS